MKTILIIDDDTELCDLLNEYLAPEGFQTKAVHDGKIGLELALTEEFSLVVLDIMLPGINGFDILNRIRAQSNIPVLMLTARGDDVDKIVGLEIGADDYLSKPFNPRELTARIRAILRRTRKHREPVKALKVEPGLNVLTIDDIKIDVGTRSVFQSGEVVSLTAVEFSLLETLVRSAGQVVLREELVSAVLGRDLTPFDRSIDVHVSKLRKKIGTKAGGQERIKTVRGVGYLYTLTADPDRESDPHFVFYV